MKLLFDQNVSPYLVTLLSDLFPNSAHVDALGMGMADDRVIASWGKENGFAVVTRDSDYVVHSRPPLACKVIWLRLGNCKTSVIEESLRREAVRIREFENHPEQTLLLLR